MSASSIPYRLRPNKFIDREIFVDLINHLVPQRGVEKYVYVSMGGKHLVDHTIVYKRTGIPNLFSLDMNEGIVLRQRFNRPTDAVACEKLASSQLASNLDKIAARFHDTTNLLIWLDYTDPKERLEQLQEIVDVAKRLQPGDILRMTFNAHPGTLDKNGSNAAWKDAGADSPGEYRCDKLREQIGEYLPASMTSIGHDQFPKAMAAAISIALAKASRESTKNLNFAPLLLTTYQDGQRMVTATVAVTNQEHPFEADCNTWRFAPTDWADILQISAPDLSMREKMKLDVELSKSSKDIIASLGFSFSEKNRDDEKRAENESVIESYKTFHRYYPSFQHTDV